MKNTFKKAVSYIFITLVVLSLLFAGYIYFVNPSQFDSVNICQNEELVAELIEKNINPFTKFKFIKKRNADCNQLLNDNKEKALKFQNEEYCSVLDSSTTSLVLVINTYVNDMYDRETASKELTQTIPLMTPYNYCPQYIDNMIVLIALKKRLGL